MCIGTVVPLVAVETGEGTSTANVGFSVYGYSGNTVCSGNW